METDDVNAGHEADDEIEFAKHNDNRPSRDIYEIKKEINNYLIIDESDVEDLKPMLNQIFKDKSKTIESLDFEDFNVSKTYSKKTMKKYKVSSVGMLGVRV